MNFFLINFLVFLLFQKWMKMADAYSCLISCLKMNSSPSRCTCLTYGDGWPLTCTRMFMLWWWKISPGLDLFTKSHLWGILPMHSLEYSLPFYLSLCSLKFYLWMWMFFVAATYVFIIFWWNLLKSVLTTLIELRLPRTGILIKNICIEWMNKIGVTKKHLYLKRPWEEKGIHWWFLCIVTYLVFWGHSSVP